MASNTGAPRLSVEISAVTTDLKKGLADARAEIQRFNKEVSKSEYKNVLDAERLATQKARTETVKFASDLKSSLSESLNNAKIYTENARKATEDYRQSLLSNKSALEQSKVATEQQRQATEAERTALANSRSELARIALEKRKGQQVTIALAGSYREAQQRLTALGNTIKNAEGGFNSKSSAIRKQISEYNTLNNKLKEFDRNMGNNQRNVGNYASALSGSIPFLNNFIGVAGLVSGAVAGINQSFNTNLRLDSLFTALRNVSGSASEFEKNLEFLRKTSDRLGLEFTSTADAFKMWQGAAKFSNLTAEESRRIFESVANAGAKMKLSNEDIKGSFLALSQMMSKGKVSSEELRQQLGERLPGAFALASKAMGVTELELSKMLETGNVMANDFLPKFATELDKSFGNDKTQQIDSMQASVNRLKNEFSQLWESENAKSFFTTVIDGVSGITAEFRRLVNSNSFKEFFTRIGEFGESGGGKLMTETDLRNQFLSTQKFTQFQTPDKSRDELFLNSNAQFFEKELAQARKHAKDMSQARIALEAGVESGRIRASQREISMYKQQESLAELHRVRMERINRQRNPMQAIATPEEQIKNKAYWEEQVASLKAVRDAMSSVDTGTKKWIETNAKLKDAQKNLDLFSNKKPKVDTQAKKDLEEVKRLTEEITSQSLSAYDAKLAEIDKKYDNIAKKIKDPDLLGLAKQNKEAEILRVSVDRLSDSLKTVKRLGSGLTAPTVGGVVIPTLERMSSMKVLGAKTAKIELDDFTKEFKSTLRRGLSSTFNDLFSSLGSMNNATFEIEKKYSDLRRDASAREIASLNEMERLEKSINNGLTNTLSKIGATFSQIGGNLLSSALSSGIASGDFKDLKGLFSGDKKAMGYGALGSMLGGVLGGSFKPTNKVGQGLSGALSGAGTGAMIGSIIPGIGTAIGAIGGALIGGLSSIFGASKAKKQEELARKQYEEQKKQTLLMERQAMLTYASQVIGQMTNQGIVTSVERDALGDLVGRIQGKDIILAIDRTKNSR